MADTIIQGYPVEAGYPYDPKITVTDFGDVAPFPVGCRLAMQFREYVGAPVAWATATTENGKLERVDDDTVHLKLTGGDTAGMVGKVVTDIVRTDLSPDRPIAGIEITIPVRQTVTQTGGDA